ncbi:hypothetical protein AB0I66_35585 [Streptomyces sp. NPDC050439]|uniref:hypothetical protein n=1 Tax=unclassified Streptomyces TaxID=2593676 RepID=UPI003416F18A
MTAPLAGANARLRASVQCLDDDRAFGLAVVALFPDVTAVVVGGSPFFIFLEAASSARTAAYPLEVFPTALRTTGVGFSTAMSRVGAAIGTFLLPMGLERFGPEFVLLVGAGLLALGGVISHFLAPDTTDMDPPTRRAPNGRRGRGGRAEGRGPAWRQRPRPYPEGACRS